MSDNQDRPGRVPGREPVTARSALGLRAILAWFGVAFGAVGALLLWLFAPAGGDTRVVWLIGALCCVAIVVTAAVDLVLIHRRRA